MVVSCVQATSQLTENIITLKGSTELVTEFFSYSINRCTSALQYLLCHVRDCNSMVY